MQRKTQAVLILFTRDFKYCLFNKSESSNFGFIHDFCNEFYDNQCPFLTIARHIITKINHHLSFQSLNKPMLSKIENPYFRSRDHFSLSKNYKEWLYYITEALQYDGYSEDVQIYLQQIGSEEHFVKNMQYLGIEYFLLDQQQILDTYSNQIDTLTHSILKKTDFKKIIEQQIQLKASPPNRENSFILILHNRVDFLKKVEMGYNPMPTKTFFYGIYKKDNQKWFTYNIAQGEIPQDDILENVQAIIMPGSASNAYAQEEWINTYKNWIRKVYETYKNIKILGICFGEQILAHTLNGKCEIVKEKKINKNFFNSGTHTLHLSDKFYEIPFIKQLNLRQKNIQITKLHGDIVVKLDESEFEIMGSSDNYEIEVYTDKLYHVNQNPKILCFQGHPEYSNQWLAMTDMQYYSFHNKISCQEAFKLSHHSNQKQDDNFILRQICQAFLILE
ncbi:hypothetical protein ABPG72_016206 [Tetrahymena utriculariae]